MPITKKQTEALRVVEKQMFLPKIESFNSQILSNKRELKKIAEKQAELKRARAIIINELREFRKKFGLKKESNLSC